MRIRSENCNLVVSFISFEKIKTKKCHQGI
jgi:hypothetical protein